MHLCSLKFLYVYSKRSFYETDETAILSRLFKEEQEGEGTCPAEDSHTGAQEP